MRTSLLLCMVTMVIVTSSAVQDNYGRGWDEEHSGAQVWSVKLPRNGQVAALQRITDDLDLLHHSDSSATVYVHPRNMEAANQLLESLDLEAEVIVDDFYRHLKEMYLVEVNTRTLSRATESCNSSSCPRPLLQSFMSFEQMEYFLKTLAAQYPSNVQLSQKGKTAGGRSVWLVKVTKTGVVAGAKQRAVFVEGGAHAREWASPSTVLNILMAQVESCVAGTACNATFYFMPIINPDGYKYSWTTNRMWRKNRSLPPTTSKTSYGTDINRNFGYKWGFSGASSTPSSEVYKGPSAFSTPEASAVRDALKAITNDTNTQLILFLSYHSYGQQILYPWSYTGSVVPPFRAENIRAAEVYSNALKAANNVAYQVMQSAALYPAAGTSDDYVTSLGVNQSFAVEVRDTGTFGFILPSSQIAATYLENWAGFKAMVTYILGN